MECKKNDNIFEDNANYYTKPTITKTENNTVTMQYPSGTTLNINIIKADRRSMCLKIKKDGTIFIRCGFFTKLTTITPFILQKANWILQNHQKIQTRIESQKYYKKQGYKTGDFIYILGKKIQINITLTADKKHHKTELIDASTLFVVAKNPASADKAILKFLTNSAKYYFQNHFNTCFNIFKSKLLQLANDHNLQHYIQNLPQPTLEVGNFASKWGSLQFKKFGHIKTTSQFFGKNSVSKLTNLNVKLALKLLTHQNDAAENNCLRYVIFHELCHIMFQDHSKSFYALQSIFVPNYQLIKKVLDI